MVAAANLSASLGLWKYSISHQVISDCLKRLKLPVNISGYSARQLWQNMVVDKKRKNDSLRFILPVAIGNVIIVENLPVKIIMEAINSILA